MSYTIWIDIDRERAVLSYICIERERQRVHATESAAVGGSWVHEVYYLDIYRFRSR